jgi:hypothetical protein
MCCLNVQTTHPPNITGVRPGTGPYKIQTTHPPNITGERRGTGPNKDQKTHPPNIVGVKRGTGPYKSADNTFTKYNGIKTRNWTQQKLYVVYVLS